MGADFDDGSGMRIGLIRHGETEWNAQGLLQGSTDIPLNDRGQDQARDAARLLRDSGWDLVYSSPLGRARETAGIIAQLAGIPAGGVLPGFTERSFGDFEGRPYWTPEHGRVNLDHPSVERADDVQTRTLAAFEQLEDAHAGESVLVVSHGSTIRLLLDLFLAERAPHLNNLALSIVERADAGAPRLVTLANGYPVQAAANR